MNSDHSLCEFRPGTIWFPGRAYVVSDRGSMVSDWGSVVSGWGSVVSDWGSMVSEWRSMVSGQGLCGFGVEKYGFRVFF